MFYKSEKQKMKEIDDYLRCPVPSKPKWHEPKQLFEFFALTFGGISALVISYIVIMSLVYLFFEIKNYL